jgi:hypothetical protein
MRFVSWSEREAERLTHALQVLLSEVILAHAITARHERRPVIGHLIGVVIVREPSAILTSNRGHSIAFPNKFFRLGKEKVSCFIEAATLQELRPLIPVGSSSKSVFEDASEMNVHRVYLQFGRHSDEH